MMNRGKLIFWFWIISLICGCDFEDTNVNPTGLADVQASVILPSAQAQTMRNLSSIGARITGTIIQHFKGIEGQPESYNVYLIDENAMDDYWRTGLYAAAMRDCHIIIQKGELENNPYYAGVARILMAVNLGIATSFWGDVPYTQAFIVDNFEPTYDAQAQVYVRIQELLDQAIEDLSMPQSTSISGQEDLIFAGNTDAWIATATALKARYYLHLSKREPESANRALDALGLSEPMTSDNVPWFRYGNSQNEANTYAFFGEDRPNQLALGDYIRTKMTDTNDPRFDHYATLENGEYLLYQRDNRDLFWTQFESPLPLISLTEVLFIQAESHLRLGNLTLADNFFQQAMASNMEVIGIADYTDYLTLIGNLEDQITFDARLQMIIEQKYLALFSQGTLESWVDFRRTGYPALTPSSGANESLNPSKVIPKRYLYPISERTSNLKNLTAAIDRQNGHLLDSPLWAFED